MSGELYPVKAVAEYKEKLTIEQDIVCRTVGEWSRDCWWALSNVTDEGGVHVGDRYLGSEVDALYFLLRIERIMDGFAGVIDSLPPVPFFEDDFSVSSVIANVRDDLPFTAEERRVAATLGLAWDLQTADWLRPLTAEEIQLVECWHSWIRQPLPHGTLPLSPAAKRIQQMCSKLNNTFDALVPRW